MRRGTLLTQVISINLLLIAAAVLAASIASDPDNPLRDSTTVGLVLGIAVAATVAVNVFLLARRFEPLERLVEEMEQADLSRPSPAYEVPHANGSEEVRRLSLTFREMLERLEAERRAGASAALEAQERERARIALDLHDEVNQALTGRPAANRGAAAKRARGPPRRAGRDPRRRGAGDGGAAQAGPPAPADLARRPRPQGGRSPASSRRPTAGPGSRRSSRPRATPPCSPTTRSWSPTGSLRRRSPTRSSTRRPHHVRVRLICTGEHLELRVTDDGEGFEPGRARRAASGSPGCASAPC